MSFVSPIVAADDARLIAPREPARALHVALAILVLATIARLSGTVDSDVAWQLSIAQRMQAGANLYRDIIETNPPLWFWMARPLERVSSLLSVRIESILIVAIALAVALSLTATNRLMDDLRSGSRTLLLAYAALTLFVMPWMHVGQREQIALIAAVPYAALTAARREGRSPSMLCAALVGIGAGLGFALKHYFLIVPVMLELWLAIGLRRRWRPIRAETSAIAAIGAAYAAAILAEGDYLVTIVPLVRQAYGTFSAPNLAYLFGPFARVGLALLAVVLSHPGALRRSSFSSALTVAGLGFAAAYFIQFKGWTYHAIPMLGCGSLALAGLLVGSGDKMRLLRLGGPALLCLPLSLSASEATHRSLPSQALLRAVAGMPPGTPVAFISEDTAIAWSVTLQHGWRYPSRYNGFWMLRAVLLNERSPNPDPGLTALGRRVVAETVADFRCLPPRRIVAQAEPLAFFLRDPAFASLLTHYALISRDGFAVYERRSALGATDAPCVSGH